MGLGRWSFELLTKFNIECTKNHVWEPLGSRDMAISILNEICIHFGFTFVRFFFIGRAVVELHSFGIHICRNSIILDLHLSNLTQLGLTLAELHLL